MQLSLRTDRSLLRANARSARYLHISLIAPTAEPRAGRLPVSIGIVLDRSGSMDGERKFSLARDAVEQSIRMLRPEDRFTLVVYDEEVDTLVAATPLLLGGLSVGLAFKAGLFNIGAQGQFLMGALATVIVGVCTSYLADSVDLLRYYKALAERAMAQVSNEQLLILLHEDMNSIAVIVKHIAIANSTTRPPLAKPFACRMRATTRSAGADGNSRNAHG